jgi:phosphoglucomutase
MGRTIKRMYRRLEEIMNAKERAASWLVEAVDIKTKSVIEEMLLNNTTELEEAFYDDLEFGTGGLRGIMGVGSMRINRYTIGSATQGLANYLKKNCSGEISVAIAYDSRNQSPELAKAAADVLTGNGIRVNLFASLRPTPVLSFAVRDMKCQAGIVITASHNPPEYNGYKVYWSDGAQVVPPHDKGIIQEVRSVESLNDVVFKGNDDLLNIIHAEWDEKYNVMALKWVKNKDAIARQSNVSVVYTSIHGSGITMVPTVLQRLGFKNIHVVQEQQEPDGHFPTVKSPNPEEKAALQMAIDLANQVNAQWVLGTDPDADRVGLCVRDFDGNMALLNGNQTGALLVYYHLQNAGRVHTNGLPYFTARTIVTSTLIEEISKSFSVPCYQTLTGFKYIASVIQQLEGKEQFLCGGEESYGYLIGDDVRDKDAVLSSVSISEMGAWCMDRGSSLWGMLMEMYDRYGLYHEELVSITIKGLEGVKKIKEMMSNFRSNTPDKLGGVKVVEVRDYLLSISRDFRGNQTDLTLPKSDVIQFGLEDGSIITARPSGTEPKIKFYFSMKTPFLGAPSYFDQVKTLQAKMKEIENELLGSNRVG